MQRRIVLVPIVSLQHLQKENRQRRNGKKVPYQGKLEMNRRERRLPRVGAKVIKRVTIKTQILAEVGVAVEVRLVDAEEPGELAGDARAAAAAAAGGGTSPRAGWPPPRPRPARSPTPSYRTVLVSR